MQAARLCESRAVAAFGPGNFSPKPLDLYIQCHYTLSCRTKDSRGRPAPRKGVPMTVTVTVAPEPRTKPGMMASLVNPAWCAGSEPVTGFYAEVEIDGATFEVSQMPGETEWTVDAAFAPGSSCPAFMNGFGARYLRTKVLQPEHAAVVEAAKPVMPTRCGAHELPGGHTCTDLCTTECSCKAVTV